MSYRPAVAAALREADQWIELVDTWRDPPDLGVTPSETAVVRFFDASDDLRRRMKQWGYPPGNLSLSDLSLFAAGLAKSEADAWRLDNEHIATQAYTARRFLLSDRILHWSIPWLRAAEQAEALPALASQQLLLGLGERHRPAPLLADGEGITVPGEDSYGPIDVEGEPADHLLSVWSGQVLVGPNRGAVANGRLPHDLAESYRETSEHWAHLAATYPGSARLWRDLSRRAARTARELAE